MFGRLVGVINASPATDFAAAGASVQAFCVTPLTLLQRGVDEYLDEPIGADHLADFIARRAIRADRCAYRDSAVAHDFRRDETDASDVRVAILATETQSPG